MKTIIGIFCIVAPAILAIYPDIKRMYNNKKSICK